MKTFFYLVLFCGIFAEINAQKKPEKRLEIIPRGELKFFNGDSVTGIPYGKLRDSLGLPKLKLFRRESKMPEYIADPDIDYKMKIFKADSTIDYKILRKRY